MKRCLVPFTPAPARARVHPLARAAAEAIALQLLALGASWILYTGFLAP